MRQYQSQHMAVWHGAFTFFVDRESYHYIAEIAHHDQVQRMLANRGQTAINP
jgi:hypothetical protein